MNVPILIRCWYKDIEWLRYCLRSIKKNAHGFSEIVVAIPSRDYAVFEPLKLEFGFRLDEYDVNEQKPMISGELCVCHADVICPDADFIFFMDSDCCMDKPCSPQDYMVNGRPVLIGRKFERLEHSESETERCMFRQWLPATLAALGWMPEYETNWRVPCMFHRGIFAPFRAAVEKNVGRSFNDYAFSCRDAYPQTFIEFTPLGIFMLSTCHHLYHFIDVDSRPHQVCMDSGLLVDYGNGSRGNALWQGWSHGPLPVAELEAICA